MKKKTIDWFNLIGIVAIVFVLAFWGTMAYVAFHFITKWW